MRTNHPMHRTISLLALALTAACGTADAQQGYGYPQQSGPAAPSTIPGRGDSEARVPVVDPAPVAMPAPRKPKPKPQPQTQPSPWGGTVPTKPTTPPVASQPPVTSRPPVVSQPPVVTQPPVVSQPNNTPPSSGPQAGANDRLTSTYRGTPKTSAIVRSGGAAQTGGSVVGASVQRTTSTVLACTQDGNTPKITRIRPANDSSLQPGGAFILEGLCFGDARGKVQVTLPTQYGRIQANEAQILDWDGEKILAQLPDGVVKAISGDAAVEVASAGGTPGAGKDIAFEPRWEKVRLNGVEMNVTACRVPNTPAPFHFCTIRSDGTASILSAIHDRGDPDSQIGAASRDRYDVLMPQWMRPADCGIAVATSTSDGSSPLGTATAAYEGNSVVVDWQFNDKAEKGSTIRYDVKCTVWVPVGVVAK